MRALYLLAIVLLAGCDYNQPISMFDLPDGICVEGPGTFTWRGELLVYYLHITDDVGEIYEWCGPGADACTDGYNIYVPEPCEKLLAHELNHFVGNDWVDNHAGE